MKKLVIVESPSKSKTIGKYLGSDYEVLASVGHIRDLATSGKYGLGVDLENDFKPEYKNATGKTKVINQLKKAVKEADYVYLATDPDREGEAISWHLKDVLKLSDGDYDRVRFYEITKDKVIDAIENSSKIDYDLVDSQEARRILDRIIGFRLSNLMRKKTRGKSAGRVQSVALKLIVDREREILAFIPEEYWTIAAHFEEFSANLYKYKTEEIKIRNEEEADKIICELKKDYVVESVERKDRKRKSKPAFTTSTMQQTASSKIGFAPKKTMSIAQELYEGIDLESERSGLITYMRTDSTRLSSEFIGQSFNFIEKEYGEKYKGSVKVKKGANEQDAHEAIRPTSIYRTPESIKKYLSTDQYKLYNLIYKRALASLMSDALFEGTTVIIDNNDFKFKATGQVLKFDGYLKVYGGFEEANDVILPTINEKDSFVADSVEKEQHFTQPPARYTEASLIKALEEKGIGRPSTYAAIIDNIKSRDYVILEKKNFKPTEIGFEVTDKLQEYFKDIINVEYTKEMEDALDKIADKEISKVKLLTEFWGRFNPLVEVAFKEMEQKPVEETGEDCPECGSHLVIREGKYGKFVACSGFPKCRYIKKEEKEEKVIGKCPSCDKGNIVEKKTRKGKIFYGCTNYPKCKMATWDEPVLKLCPECKALLSRKDGVVKCSKCDYKED